MDIHGNSWARIKKKYVMWYKISELSRDGLKQEPDFS